MKLKTISKAVAALALAAGVAGAAQAAYINTGDLSISFDYYDSGTSYGAALIAAGGCFSAVDCDAVAAGPTFGQGTVVVGGNNIKTDTQGIFRINTITNTNTSATLYDVALDSYVLSGIFSGLYDLQVTVDASGNISTRGGGGVFEVFKNAKTAANLSLGGIASGGAGVDVNRNLTNLIFKNPTTGGTISGGTLWLKANFAESVIVDGSSPNATFQSTWATGTSATGSSSAFLDIDTAAGGDGLGWFAQDTMEDQLGNKHDMYYSSSFNIVPTSASPGTQQWNIRNNTGQVVANVPEPGSLALVGLGMAGLGFLRRRKSA